MSALMKRPRDEDGDVEKADGDAVESNHDFVGQRNGDDNGSSKKLKPEGGGGGLISTTNGGLLPLFSYDDDEDEEEKEKAKEPESPQYEYESDEELERSSRLPFRRDIEVRKDCPYLDTVNRQVLDFDFEKFCSVSLSNLNVYACLVCGKYFQGRGRNSHAYTHSLEAGHHVFINLHSEKVYCLPDGYEVNDPSLDDIRYVLNPRFTRAQVEQLDKNKQWARALDGSDYLPGMVGLNNIKENDFVNVIIQSLMRVTPLRDFFLIPENYGSCKSPLVQRFGELTRKIWHPRNFKGQWNSCPGSSMPFIQILGVQRKPTVASFSSAFRGSWRS